jgi:uncharacterized protein
MGGGSLLAAHAEGIAHKFTKEEARHAGKRGDWVTSRDRQHMARIGRKGRATAQQKRAEETKGKQECSCAGKRGSKRQC